VLFAAVAALLVMLAMRISGSRGTRHGLAIALIVLGALCVALPVADAARAKDRFGGVEGVDRLAKTLSVQLGLPEDVVRERLADLLAQDLRVEISAGLWVTVAGGVLLVAGGVLGLAWVRRDGAHATVRVESDPG
jgi:hypothetical protein